MPGPVGNFLPFVDLPEAISYLIQIVSKEEKATVWRISICISI
jgi:hypothetical protein